MLDDHFYRMESALHQLMAATVQRQQDLTIMRPNSQQMARKRPLRKRPLRKRPLRKRHLRKRHLGKRHL
ncbi:unnamed protein product [Boreogadus saida]